MTVRYFAEPPISGDRALLTGPEAHHLIHVMRAKPGSRVVLFDGSGAEFTARVERFGRTDVELTVLARDPVDRELPLQLTLGVTLPKGDRRKWLVEKAVELGVGRLVPLVTARSVVRAGPQAAARLRRAVIEASKQCGRNRLMEITEAQSWPDFIATTQGAPCRLLAHPQSRSSPRGSSGIKPPGAATLPRNARQAKAVVLAVGPEGGFTPDEVATALAAGWQPVDLGPRILRVETAAVLLAALVVQSVTPGLSG
jgi:16S rRNA (uracil1498-N3)-methyltransferase